MADRFVREQTKAYSHALAAVLLWSTVASAFKLSLRFLSPAALLLHASMTAVVVLFIVLILQRKLSLLYAMSPRQYLRSALMGFLNPFLYYLVLFKAYALLPGQEAQALNFTWAIALAILSIPLLKQKIRPQGFLALLISLAGVYVISTRGDLLSFKFTDPLGVSLALGSSLIWAYFWILNLQDQRDAVAKLLLSFACGSACALIYCAATGQLAMPGSPGALGAAYVGVFEMGITFLIWLKALKFSRTTAQVANLIFLSPFISLALLHLVVGEEIYISSGVGLMLIVAGIVIQKKTGSE